MHAHRSRQSFRDLIECDTGDGTERNQSIEGIALVITGGKRRVIWALEAAEGTENSRQFSQRLAASTAHARNCYGTESSKQSEGKGGAAAGFTVSDARSAAC